jgi:multidrug efflux pump subunit AcrB
VKVWVRFREEGRSSMESLENMRIRTAEGNYPLKELAEFDVERGVLSINHRGGEREINVSASLADPKYSASNINLKIQNEFLPPILSQYPSVKASFEGQTRESGKVGKSAAAVMPIVIILMLAVVMIVFRSVLQTFVIFLILPLGLVGVALGHILQGIPVSILSAYGIIALIGIIINNSVVLVTYLNRSLKTGQDFTEAVYEAGLSRFRPILLTTLTTIGGLAPLMFAQSLQAQFLIPMAVSVAYGMLFGMFVTLIILPVMLILLNRLRYGLVWLWTGQRPVFEQLEPAVRELRTSSDNENE